MEVVIVTKNELSAGELTFVGSEEGELMRFTDAVLASAEVNRNQDEVTVEGIRELATTLIGKAIDLEHVKDAIVGYYTDAAEVAGDLVTAGIIFSGRFPKVAKGIVDGSLLKSIEATAEKAQCSKCGKEFVGSTQYCSHLTNRRSSGAVRKLFGMVAVGGAVVAHPAGKKAGFDPGKLELWASVGNTFNASEADPNGSLRAALQLMGEAGCDVFPANPHAQTTQYSPVFAPMAYRDPYPAWAEVMSERVAAAVMEKLSAEFVPYKKKKDGDAEDKSDSPPMDAALVEATNQLNASVTDALAQIKALNERDAAREEAAKKIAQAGGGLGFTGVTWDSPKPNTQKVPQVEW